MPQATYSGPHRAISVGGVRLRRGEPVEVDEAAAGRLRRRGDVTVADDPPDPRVPAGADDDGDGDESGDPEE